MEFPRLVYRSASDHVLVETPEEFDAHIADGWFASVPEAVTGKHDTPVTPRDDLEAQAKELGIKFDGRNSDASLSRMIDEALKD